MIHVETLPLKCGYVVKIVNTNKYQLVNLKSELYVLLTKEKILPFVEAFGTKEDVEYIENFEKVVKQITS